MRANGLRAAKPLGLTVPPSISAAPTRSSSETARADAPAGWCDDGGAGVAQQKAMPVGRLSPRCLARPVLPSMDAFRRGLSDTGYVEGQNLAIGIPLGGGPLRSTARIGADDEGAGPPRGKCRLVEVEEKIPGRHGLTAGGDWIRTCGSGFRGDAACNIRPLPAKERRVSRFDKAYRGRELEDSMGRAARTWQLRRCNLTDGVPRCPSRTT